jgi:hypothetical protein
METFRALAAKVGRKDASRITKMMARPRFFSAAV